MLLLLFFFLLHPFLYSVFSQTIEIDLADRGADVPFSKFYVLQNGTHTLQNPVEESTKSSAFSPLTLPLSDLQQYTLQKDPEEWVDVSGGNSMLIDKISKDPSYERLFNMDLDIISDHSGTDAIFNWGDPDYRTAENCFIIGLHSGAEQDVISLLSKSLEVFNGSTTDTLLHSVKGTFSCFPEKILPLTLLTKIPWLKLVERDSVFSSSQIQSNAPWGLSRISNPALPISGKFGFQYTGSGVDVFVMDSGINTRHQGRRMRLT